MENPVTITYSAVIDGGLTDPTLLVNPVLIDDGQGNLLQRIAAVMVNGIGIYLPLTQNP